MVCLLSVSIKHLRWGCLFPHGVNPSIKVAALNGGEMLSEGSKLFPLGVPL